MTLESQRRLRRTQRLLRKERERVQSHEEFLAAFDNQGDKESKKKVLRRRSAVQDNGIVVNMTTAMAFAPMNLFTSTPLAPMNPSTPETFADYPIENITLTTTPTTPVANSTTTSTTTTTTTTTTPKPPLPPAEPILTVHRISLRTKSIIIRKGTAQARVRYIVQLHRPIDTPHKLTMEVSLNPGFPPLYIG